MAPQPASAVSGRHIKFVGKRPRLPPVKEHAPVSVDRNNFHRRPYLANLARSLRSRIFNIRIPSAETWFVCTETGSILCWS